MQSSVSLYNCRFGEGRTYVLSALFVVGNVVLPQLFHLVPRGGMIWLPIYFFTLVAAYKYGWKAGVMTALASPVVNSLLFGMPAAAALPAILLKSILLALCAAAAARRFGRVSLWLLAGVVVCYQALGTLGEWALSGSLLTAFQDVRLGLPGMALQVVGGYLCIRRL